MEHHHAGRLAEAEALYRQILLAAPQHADALHLLGGQQPVTGATITLWFAGSSGYGSTGTSLSTTTTDATGSSQHHRQLP